MSALSCFKALIEGEYEWRCEGERLAVSRQSGPIPPDFIASLHQHKSELLGTLRRAVSLLFVDFETRAAVRLEDVGSFEYVAHDSFEVTCAAFVLPCGRSQSWSPNEPLPEAVLAALATNTPLVAHNAHGFDRLVWERIGLPNPNEWIDTLPLSRLINLPGQLEKLGQRVVGVGKDREGAKLVKRVTEIDRATGRLPQLDRATLDSIQRYCRRDVQLLRAVWCVELAPYRELDRAVIDADAAINARGFPFDTELAHAAIELERKLARDAHRAAGVDASLTASPKQFASWLQSHTGAPVENIRRETLENLATSSQLPADVARAIDARYLSSGIVGKKLSSGCRRASRDGRIRGSLDFAVAKTGRWAGRGLQPHNLPRGIKLDDDRASRLAAVLKRGDVAGLSALASEWGSSVRDVFACAARLAIAAHRGTRLAIVDYGQIEARILMWIARDEKGLEAYRMGDPYLGEAARLLGKPRETVSEFRPLGKVLVLGAGFGAGSEKFRTYAESMGIDWGRMPVTSRKAIEGWRDNHPLVAGSRTGDEYQGAAMRRGGLWKDTEAAAIHAFQYRQRRSVGRFYWEPSGKDLVCALPSGRPLRYCDIELAPAAGRRTPKLTYVSEGGRKETYGGKLVENIVQATARDILASALVKLERASIPVVLHVHDEIVCEVADHEAEAMLERIRTIAAEPPSWARDLPLAVDGFTSERYRK